MLDIKLISVKNSRVPCFDSAESDFTATCVPSLNTPYKDFTKKHQNKQTNKQTNKHLRLKIVKIIVSHPKDNTKATTTDSIGWMEIICG